MLRSYSISSLSILATLLFVLSVSSLGKQCSAQANKGYYRFPAIHQKTIVFVAEGDLWKVSIKGGLASRLTSHPGEETNPYISPDGKTIAYAAEYEGPTEVYTMPIEGGKPQRRTVEAEPSVPVGWTLGGKLVYTTQHYSTLPNYQLVTVDLQSNHRQRIPLSQASDSAFAPDGALYFVRPRFHNHQTKRYQGGTARNIWRFHADEREATLLTKEIKGESHSPWWHEGRLYFVTDSDGTMNIWSMTPNGKELQQHTQHSGWDVKSMSLHGGRIVYRVGADIWILDIATGVYRSVPIRLQSDFDQLRERWVTKPIKNLSSAHLSPDGSSVALVTRGRLFVAPVGSGRLVRINQQGPGIRYRSAVFMPDGKNLLTLSDASGEYEFWQLSRRGMGEASQVTETEPVLKWRGYPSPNAKYVAYSDKNNDLWIVDQSTKQRALASLNREGIEGIAWSPDSRWIVFGQEAENTYQQLYLYNVESKTATALTSDRVNSMSPAWSADGKWLYFLSDRSLHSLVGSPWGTRQPEPYFDKSMKLYRLAMTKGLRSPFKESDELYSSTQDDAAPQKDLGEGDGTKSDETDEDTGDQNQAAPIEIGLENIRQRVKPLPVERGNYRLLAANKKGLFWLQYETGSADKKDLMSLAIGNKHPKPKKLVSGVKNFELSGDKTKLLVHKGNSLYVIDAKPGSSANLTDKRVDLSSWQYSIKVRDDWRQLFVDAWRLHRDYFYDPGMHGVNWNAVREKYEPLVDRVTSRSELSDLIAQMIAELSVLHSKVYGGDLRQSPDDIALPTLGARLVHDENQGGYRIDYIYQSDPDYPSELSPLADPDLNIQNGDILQAINGAEVLSSFDPHLLLREHQGEQVLLKIKRAGEQEPSEVIVKPTWSEAALRYRDWEYTRRLEVEEKGAGKIGYVHLRAMGRSDLAQWYRNFYPVFNRQGLIVDVRHNRGGNIDSIILEKLLRKAWFYWKRRVGKPTTNMQYAFRGHVVVLCDERTASDGEAFAEGFRRLGLGKVIGKRTWGGEIWLSSSNRLSDGGIATAAETGVYGPERQWLIEGHGVDPDIVVDNLPHATFNGQDAQLETAIKHLQQLIKEDPRLIPEPPEYPDKSFSYP